jgi:ribonucleotide monophosphatase NagD (HAD superfamily)
VLFGKPYRVTYEYAIQRITELAEQRGHAEPPQRIYAVGDNPLSGAVGMGRMCETTGVGEGLTWGFIDIKGANAMGWTSVLVRTGCFQSTDDNDAQHPATHVCPSITGTLLFFSK